MFLHVFINIFSTEHLGILSGLLEWRVGGRKGRKLEREGDEREVGEGKKKEIVSVY